MGVIQNHWRYDASATAGNASLPVFIPRRVDIVSVAVIPGGGGTAYCEYTLAAGDDVSADPSSVTWITWEPGSVGVKTARSLTGPVTAVRVVAATQPGTMQVVGSFDF